MSTTAPSERPRSGRVALVGRPNVGKSTLLNALLGEPIAITSPHPQTTREAVRGVLTTGHLQLVFVDTPGVHVARSRLGERMNEVARQSASEADALVLVMEPRVDPADLALAAELGRTPTVVAINKTDRLRDKTKLLPLLEELGHRGSFAALVPLSARRGEGTDRLVAEVGALLPEQPFLFDPDTLSDQP